MSIIKILCTKVFSDKHEIVKAGFPQANFFARSDLPLLSKGPFIIYTSGGHRREIKKSIYKKITQPFWVSKFFLPNL